MDSGSHKFLISGAGFKRVVGKKSKSPLCAKPTRRGSHADRGLIRTPEPFAGVSSEACADWVEHYVACKFKQIVLFLHKHCVIAPLKDVSDPIVGFIEFSSEVSVQPGHAPRKIRFFGFNHNVEVVGHLAPGVTRPLKVFAYLCEQANPESPIALVRVYAFFSVAARSDVIQRARELNSMWSAHAEMLERAGASRY
jgi:hypothetical protein